MEDAYTNLYAFDLIITDAKQRIADREIPLWRAPRTRQRISLRRVSRADTIMLPEDQIILQGIKFQSEGFWDFLGALNPLEVLRKYLADRHERAKDHRYRNAAEEQRLTLENAKLQTEVVKEQVALLREIGVPEDKIREALTKHVSSPLGKLDSHQDSGLISGARFIDDDAGKKN